MLGAIVGDVCGSHYEFHAIKTKEFDFYVPEDKNQRYFGTRFTDDTVLTVAVANSLKNNLPMKDEIHKFGNLFIDVGYGPFFMDWLSYSYVPNAYGSFGNGSAMRCSYAGWVATSMLEARSLAKASAMPTHSHDEGIKGAEAVAAAIFMARHNYPRYMIKEYIQESFGYELNRSVDEVRDGYKFKVTCQESVPEAIICFLHSTSFEDTIRNAISLGGDADTQAAIAGSIAEAYYNHIPEDLLAIAKGMILNYEDKSKGEYLLRMVQELNPNKDIEF